MMPTRALGRTLLVFSLSHLIPFSDVSLNAGRHKAGLHVPSTATPAIRAKIEAPAPKLRMWSAAATVFHMLHSRTRTWFKRTIKGSISTRVIYSIRFQGDLNWKTTQWHTKAYLAYLNPLFGLDTMPG